MVFCQRLWRSLLIDSGADVSVFAASVPQKMAPSTAVLRAANGTTIKTFGERAILLSSGPQRLTQVPFGGCAPANTGFGLLSHQ